ncbi:hypothetical protein [Lishizhenia sp.]|uniref:hypothetical protein n=1 Tax=Lishizhenia sp. TaxID=2497594 RepID=UPI00299EA892|nr:hypothetical protein [Lishizhenia sp.]MDX1445210.1 hypothetical protein [Lishizhenia sp.]
MKSTLVILISFFNCISFGQTQLKTKIDSLKYTTNIASICRSENVMQKCELCNACGDVFFWEIVQAKDSAIPILLDKIIDTTQTKAPIQFAGINYTVGDVALLALMEIIHDIPLLDIINTKHSSREAPMFIWKHLNQSLVNRKQFADTLRSWYNTHQNKLIWSPSNDFEICDCSGPHPNGGHYTLSED